MLPRKALLDVGEKLLALTRAWHRLGKFRLLCGAAKAQPDACRAFYRQGAERIDAESAAYLRRANDAATLQVKNPRLAATCFWRCSWATATSAGC